MDNQAVLSKIVAAYSQVKHEQGFQQLVRAVDLIKQIVLKDRMDNLYVSFNGGKDATVATFLMFVALKELQKPIIIKCLYFQQPQPFDEMQQFIKQMQKLLNLTISTLSSKNFQKQLTAFNQHHPLEWVVMGSRKDDPGCAHLAEIADSDVHKGYPAFKRVNPMIDWSCTFLWKVIQELGLPYCKLYNQGYTSIGNKGNTWKNHELLDKKTNKYLAASEAPDQTQRKNRQKL